MIKAVIFDLFGVLLTDALELVVAEVRATQPLVADRIVRSVVASNAGLITHDESRETIARLLGITVDEYSQRIRGGEVRNRELLDYILKLRKVCKTALLSNAGTKSLEVRFAPGELEQYFDAVLVSAVIGYAKPEARAYELAADSLKVRNDECIMVDDRQPYCDGAERVGMRSIRYESFAQFKRDLSELIPYAAQQRSKLL